VRGFTFFNVEIPRTHERREPVQPGAIGGTVVTAHQTVEVCVTVVEKGDLIKIWTTFGITENDLAFLA
jgi:hypothetical protein